MLFHTYLFKTGKILTTQSTDFGYSFVSFFPRRIIRAAERFFLLCDCGVTLRQLLSRQGFRKTKYGESDVIGQLL